MARRIYGNVEIRDGRSLKLFDNASEFSIALKSPSSLSADLEFELPGTDGSSGQVLATDGNGGLSWVGRLSGPGAVTNNTLVIWDGSSGNSIKGSSVTLNEDSELGGLALVSTSELETVELDTEFLSVSTSLTLLDPGDGLEGITLQAPTLSASYTLTLPDTEGLANQVLTSDGAGNAVWQAPLEPLIYNQSWVTLDTNTLVVEHNLATTEVIVNIFDVATGETIWIDSITRTDANNITLVASEAPASEWRVQVLALPT